MSRIEKALEKAAIIRSGGEPLKEQQSVSVEKRSYQKNYQSLPEPESKIILDNRNLFPLLDPSSPASEEYRKLKSSLVKFTTQDENFKNIIMVTSAIANEGKSLTSLNLAISLAQGLDHTVLLVDADFRRPSIHRYLGIETSKGFADCLCDDLDPSDLLINTGIGKLVIFPAGREVPNPVELFSSQKAKDLLQELKNRYPDRYVIIDTPPLLPFAESRHLSHLVDAIIFVVRERAASQFEIAEALETLKGTNLLGIIYNNASIDFSDKRYSQYYASPYVR
jgi:receptor protein-tyrosine kinase/non-specific protein-tyrosine kinase